MSLKQSSVTVVLTIVFSVLLRAEEGGQKPSPTDVFRSFSKDWDETTWVPKGEGQRKGYLRPDDDKGWKTRMQGLQILVRGGSDSTAPLIKTLRDGTTSERVLAAQTLGFLGDKTVRDELAKAAEFDADGAVRLYAADSVGMLGGEQHRQTLERLAERESNRDAKRHLGYTLAREGNTLDASFVELLKSWDSRQMDSASVGKMAPDFELPSLSTEKVRLSDFRGKSAVVLIFIYGDT